MAGNVIKHRHIPHPGAHLVYTTDGTLATYLDSLNGAGASDFGATPLQTGIWAVLVEDSSEDGGSAFVVSHEVYKSVVLAKLHS